MRLRVFNIVEWFVKTKTNAPLLMPCPPFEPTQCFVRTNAIDENFSRYLAKKKIEIKNQRLEKKRRRKEEIQKNSLPDFFFLSIFLVSRDNIFLA